MKRKAMLFLLAAVMIPLLAMPVYPVELTQSSADRGYAYGNLDVSVRLTGGKGAVLRAGEDIRLTFQVPIAEPFGTVAVAVYVPFRLSPEVRVRFENVTDCVPTCGSISSCVIEPLQSSYVSIEVQTPDKSSVNVIDSVNS